MPQRRLRRIEDGTAAAPAARSSTAAVGKPLDMPRAGWLAHLKALDHASSRTTT